MDSPSKAVIFLRRFSRLPEGSGRSRGLCTRIGFDLRFLEAVSGVTLTSMVLKSASSDGEACCFIHRFCLLLNNKAVLYVG